MHSCSAVLIDKIISHFFSKTKKYEENQIKIIEKIESQDLKIQAISAALEHVSEEDYKEMKKAITTKYGNRGNYAIHTSIDAYEETKEINKKLEKMLDIYKKTADTTIEIVSQMKYAREDMAKMMKTQNDLVMSFTNTMAQFIKSSSTN